MVLSDQTGHRGGLFSYWDIYLYLWILSSFQSGTFNDLDHHQVAALASCFIPGDKSTEQIHLRTELAKPLQQLQDSARRIAEIQHECKLEVNVDEYVESTARPYLMDVIYCWSKVGIQF
ncbi:DExH-box ATP-dependent RNA helicase DExH10 [Vitis vinifera]|uniref:DExH-box ATP-dependent RNA helicase DExH10 n=1 Tax=Vitis vinifera TaxID=29760 RepID=A0A438HWB8_VITVI|nr:DExH-box ATP-dependent RNA helicase DExH10 [Vitis vinifera]